LNRISRGRRVWRLAVRGVLAVLAVSLFFPPLYSLVAAKRHGDLPPLPMPAPGSYRVLIADWGYHTAIVAEQPRGWALGPPREERAPFLEYAWGDRRFYMESDYSAIFATLVLPTASVVYVDGRPDPPPLGGARSVYQRTVDAATLRTLLRELEGSFQRTEDGARREPFPSVAGYRGRFYPARGRYLWANDCNWWTVQRLAGAGLADRAAGVVFSGQVSPRLRGFQPAASEAPAR
jgi:hypothetical protein